VTCPRVGGHPHEERGSCARKGKEAIRKRGEQGEKGTRKEGKTISISKIMDPLDAL